MFAGGLDFSSPVKKFFYDPLGTNTAFVDTVVSLTGFALVGGPARQVCLLAANTTLHVATTLLSDCAVKCMGVRLCAEVQGTENQA